MNKLRLYFLKIFNRREYDKIMWDTYEKRILSIMDTLHAVIFDELQGDAVVPLASLTAPE